MINTTYFLALFLVFIRVSTFFILIPVIFPTGTPGALKVGLAGVMAFAIIPGIDVTMVQNVNNNLELVTYFFNEVMTGLVLGFITSMVFSTIRMAGNLMDMQVGFAMLSIFDPNSNSNVTLIERLIYWSSFVLFLMIDGHHMLIRALITSFESVNIGNTIIFQDTIMLTINAFIECFAIGLKIAIPIVLIIIITDLTLGLIARTVPQLNIMILGLPVKILVGLLCFSMTLPALFNTLVYVFEQIPDMYKGIFNALPVMFIFASEEKTEEATPKKQKEARDKGQIPRSKEVGLALTLLASTIVVAVVGSFVGNNLKSTVIYFLSQDLLKEFTYLSLQTIILTVILRCALIILPVVIPIMITGIVASYLQTGVVFTGEGLKPKLSKLNPIEGFKKMFSQRTFVELLKDIAIVSVVGYVGYGYVSDNLQNIFNISTLRVQDMPSAFSDISLGIFKRITLVMVIIAVLDYIYQRFMHNKDLKMTKQEIKEEYKQSEGDPQVKSKIKQKQREMATRRMMQQVPEATVVVTNPTHISVALKYEEGTDKAPKVIAKGSEYVALRIKEIAKENKVPVIENKPLARMIYNEVEIDGIIPMSMYQAVAEILALVYKLKQKKK